MLFVIFNANARTLSTLKENLLAWLGNVSGIDSFRILHLCNAFSMDCHFGALDDRA